MAHGARGAGGDGRVRPVGRLFAAYAAAAGAALLFPHRPAAWPLLLLAHAAAVIAALRLPPAARPLETAGRRWPRLATAWRDFYPLIMLPALYLELAVLNRAVHDGRYFDPLVLRWEAGLFGGQPSRELAAALPLPALSETLHAAYLSYYLLIYAPPLVLYLQRRFAAFREMLFALMLTFFVHYLFFIYFPVQGPRYLFPPPGGELADGVVYGLAHGVLEAGSSRGAAFPSSHVAIAVVQTVLTVRHLPRLAPLVALLTLGLAAGAVYGGFHYAVDALAGALLGLVLVLASPFAARLLGRM